MRTGGTIIFLCLIVPTLAMSEEQPLGPISPKGATIETENYRCEVISPYTMRCENIGRVCRAYRTAKEIEGKKQFGCAIETSPNYPCPPWDETLHKIDEDSKSGVLESCMPLMLGGF